MNSSATGVWSATICTLAIIGPFLGVRGALGGLCGATASPRWGTAPLRVEFNGPPSQCERNRGKEF